MMNKYIQLASKDNVAVALQNLKAGDILDISGQDIVLTQDIQFGHKVALRAISPNEQVIKYGLPIGIATTQIAAGEHVHSHNLRTNYQL